MNNSEPSAVSLPLSQRAQRLSAPGTSSMRSKANALKEAGINVVNFAAGELSFDACPVMKAAATDALATARNRYTPPIGLPQLRHALAQQVTQRCGVNYAADEIAVTAGAKQALYNAAMVLLNPGMKSSSRCRTGKPSLPRSNWPVAFPSMSTRLRMTIASPAQRSRRP